MRFAFPCPPASERRASAADDLVQRERQSLAALFADDALHLVSVRVDADERRDQAYAVARDQILRVRIVDVEANDGASRGRAGALDLGEHRTHLCARGAIAADELEE